MRNRSGRISLFTFVNSAVLPASERPSSNKVFLERVDDKRDEPDGVRRKSNTRAAMPAAMMSRRMRIEDISIFDDCLQCRMKNRKI